MSDANVRRRAIRPNRVDLDSDDDGGSSGGGGTHVISPPPESFSSSFASSPADSLPTTLSMTSADFDSTRLDFEDDDDATSIDSRFAGFDSSSRHLRSDEDDDNDDEDDVNGGGDDEVDVTSDSDDDNQDKTLHSGDDDDDPATSSSFIKGDNIIVSPSSDFPAEVILPDLTSPEPPLRVTGGEVRRAASMLRRRDRGKSHSTSGRRASLSEDGGGVDGGDDDGKRGNADEYLLKAPTSDYSSLSRSSSPGEWCE